MAYVFKFIFNLFLLFLAGLIWGKPKEGVEEDIKSGLNMVRNSKFSEGMKKLRTILNYEFEKIPQSKKDYYLPLIYGMLGRCNYEKYTYNVEDIEALEKSKQYMEKSFINFPKQHYQRDYTCNLFFYSHAFYEFAVLEDTQQNLMKAKELMETTLRENGKANKVFAMDVYNKMGLCYIQFYKESKDVSYLYKAIESYTNNLNVKLLSGKLNSRIANTNLNLGEVYNLLANESQDKIPLMEKAEQHLDIGGQYYIRLLQKAKKSEDDAVIKLNLGLYYLGLSKIKDSENCLKKSETYYKDIINWMKDMNIEKHILYREAVERLASVQELKKVF